MFVRYIIIIIRLISLYLIFLRVDMEDDEEVRDKNNSGTGPECGKENAAAAAVAFPEKFE